MVNQEIVDYLKKQMNKGFEEEEVRNMAIRRGYKQEEIEEALDSMNAPEPVQQEAAPYSEPEQVKPEKRGDYPEPKPINQEPVHTEPIKHEHVSLETYGGEPKEEPKHEEKHEEPKEEPKQEEKADEEKHEEKHDDLFELEKPKSKAKFWIIALIIIIALGAGAYARFFSASCGNGITERGETYENCCWDAGCLGDQICEGNVCLEPVCTECQYLDNHYCRDYECCNNTQCNATSECKEHKCVPIPCTECEYLVNGTCKRYECCNNTECLNGTFCIDHECTEITCGACQYLENQTCLNYTCCSDSQCNDNISTTIDDCLNPGTKLSVCNNVNGTPCTTSADCDDNNASTKDICLATSGLCAFAEITECLNNDDVCPENCEYADDNDCTGQLEDCGLDIDCFMDNIDDDCTPSMIYYEYTIEDDRRIMGYEADYEVRGKESGDCIFYTHYVDVTLDYSDNLTQELLNNGTSQSVIDEMEDEEEDDFEHDYQGKEKICYYPEYDLYELWEDFDDGLEPDFDDEEFDYDCEGSFYD